MNKDVLPSTDRMPVQRTWILPGWRLFQTFYFVAFCEPVPVAYQNQECQTHRTVGLLVLALMETPAATLIASDLPRLI